MLKKLLQLAVLIFFSAVTTLHAAIDPTLDWYTIESEHLFVHYADGYKARAERALLIAEKAHARHTNDFNWQPLEKTHIVLSDETDFPNGFATPIFFNRTVLFLAPPTSVNTLEDFDDWFTTLITHEYTHIIHLDKSAGAPEYLRGIFGRFFLLFPNAYQPAWITEGLATHKETDLMRGIGRGQSTMFETMMREEVIKGLQPVDHVNLPVATWPAGTTRYLYGSQFMAFIAETRNEEALHNWVQGYSDNLLPFFINTNANQTLGANLTPLWKDYSNWLKEKYDSQIAQITNAGLKQGVQISADAYSTDQVQVLDKDVYFVRNNGYQQASLIKINAAGEYKVLAELNGSANLDVHKKRGILLTQDEFCNRYHVYRDIYRYDEEKKELIRLTKCGRYIFASWHPDGQKIFAANHQSGVMTLHQLNAEGGLQEVLWRGDNDEVLGQIDVSPDGDTLVATMWRHKLGWNIETFDLNTRQWQAITRGTEIESAPQYTPDGNILFGHEKNHAYNLYLYNTQNKSTVQISNVLGSAFQASQGEKDGPIYYAGYTAEGHSIFKLEDPTPITSSIKRANVSSDTTLLSYDYEDGDHAQRDYSPWPSMRPRWWFPFFGFTEQRSPVGISTVGSDALGFHNYSLAGSWDFKLDVFEGSASYAYADRLFLSLARNSSVFLDTNNELAFSTVHNIAGATYAFPFRKILSQHEILAGVFLDQEVAHKAGTVMASIPDFEDHILGLAWLYNSTKNHPLSISRNDGMTLRVVAEDSDTLDADYTGQVYTLDWKQFIRTGKESVLALRFLQGWGTDNPRPFELGGEDVGFSALGVLFGGQSASVFNQRKYPLRGYREGQPQLRGRRSQLLTAEWRFPFQRNERGIMTPPIGLMQWSGSVFVESGAAYQNSPDTYYSSAGFEIVADSNLFYFVPLRFRVGYAHGFDSEIGDDRLYMSLGSAF
ncbi:hypothetical protein MNBD_GAMMA06-547 [hydrothermal vent metagenome]|uniref:TolB protein, periplasmic protein involved in the tonb-independent uptake of group A colicins n=1 Tax=hydrothermal vent metagenome TaxID=652676 RepID=A0A3B0WPZ2_9ZZZZ